MDIREYSHFEPDENSMTYIMNTTTSYIEDLYLAERKPRCNYSFCPSELQYTVDRFVLIGNDALNQGSNWNLLRNI